MINLKTVATIELINELKTRVGVEKGASGLHKEYDLTLKYTHHDRHIESDLLLFIRSLDKLS